MSLTLGARFDEVEYEVGDRIGGNGGGHRRFSEFSPVLGLNWVVHDAVSAYGNVSTSFDPPSTTELANPYGPTGFNPDLEPQTATNFELGVKGLIAGSLRYELALFHIDVRDAIVPFELGGSGQAFYENAGRSTREGLETAVTVRLAPGLSATATYTWSDFRFDRFVGLDGQDYAGNRIPGVPEHLFNLDLSWNSEFGLFANWDLLYAGGFFADNANAVATDAYVVSNLRLGYRWQHGRWSFEPFAGISNLFDESYAANVRLNAAFGRYYEPAPDRNGYLGLLIRLDGP